jgi:hypothetical protein
LKKWKFPCNCEKAAAVQIVHNLFITPDPARILEYPLTAASAGNARGLPAGRNKKIIFSYGYKMFITPPAGAGDWE